MSRQQNSHHHQAHFLPIDAIKKIRACTAAADSIPAAFEITHSRTTENRTFVGISMRAFNLLQLFYMLYDKTPLIQNL